MRRTLLLSCLAIALSSSSFSQISQAPTQVSSATAISIINAAIAGTGAASLQDLKLSATHTWVLGPTSQTGTATLELKGTGLSRVDVPAASRREIINAQGDPDGEWIGSDGVAHHMAYHNVLVPAAWFVPHTSLLLAAASGSALTYVGQETHNGLTVDHVRVGRTVPAKSPVLASFVQGLADFDLYLDTSTHLPLFLAFQLHEDNNALRNVPIEIRFADYRSVSGINVPYRIQRLISGSLNLDLTVTSAITNSGIPDSDFALQ